MSASGRPDVPRKAVILHLPNADNARFTVLAKDSPRMKPVASSMMPSLPSNGSHVHISLNPPTDADSFLASIMNKIRTLCAIGLANWDSYVRIGVEGTGAWVGYGTENRNLPIRKIDNGHWELRCVDATANLYLFLASLLSAGSDGIKNGQPLIWKDLTRYPFDFTPEELSEYGITEKMPASLSASVEVLKNDKDAQRWMGRAMYDQYLDIKSTEVKTWIHMSAQDRARKFVKFF